VREVERLEDPRRELVLEAPARRLLDDEPEQEVVRVRVAEVVTRFEVERM